MTVLSFINMKFAVHGVILNTVYLLHVWVPPCLVNICCWTWLVWLVVA